MTISRFRLALLCVAMILVGAWGMALVQKLASRALQQPVAQYAPAVPVYASPPGTTPYPAPGPPGSTAYVPPGAAPPPGGIVPIDDASKSVREMIAHEADYRAFLLERFPAVAARDGNDSELRFGCQSIGGSDDFKPIFSLYLPTHDRRFVVRAIFTVQIDAASQPTGAELTDLLCITAKEETAGEPGDADQAGYLAYPILPQRFDELIALVREAKPLTPAVLGETALPYPKAGDDRFDRWLGPKK